MVHVWNALIPQDQVQSLMIIQYGYCTKKPIVSLYSLVSSLCGSSIFSCNASLNEELEMSLDLHIVVPAIIFGKQMNFKKYD